MSFLYRMKNPLVIWDDDTYYIVSKQADPQSLAPAIALFPKTDPESHTHAKLFKKLWSRYQEYEKYESRR